MDSSVIYQGFHLNCEKTQNMAKVSAPLNWTDKTYFCCAVTLYGIAMVYSVFLWRKGFQRDDWVVYGVLAGGLVLHTVAMAKRGFNCRPARSTISTKLRPSSCGP